MDRLLGGLAVLFLVHLATFAALRCLPGDPWGDLAGDRGLPAAAVARLQDLYGHGRPWIHQYLDEVGARLTGDFGVSLKLARGLPVTEVLASAAPVSIGLGCGALLVGLIVGLTAGAWAAWRAGSWPDRLVRVGATIGISLPDYVLATGLLLLFALVLHWLPAGGMTGPASLVLPVLTLGLPLGAALARLVRAALVEELQGGFVRTARAKGAGDLRLLAHALRPALGPVLAWLAQAAAGVLTGSMVVEQVFGLPGLGAAFVTGALAQDWTVVSGAALLYTAVLVVFNGLADTALVTLDPRTR